MAFPTWEPQPRSNGALLTVVDQVTSLVDAGMIDGHLNGHGKTSTNSFAGLLMICGTSTTTEARLPLVVASGKTAELAF